MEIKVLFNSLGKDDGFSLGWGLSLLINNRIIFDTGERGDFLINNIKKMKVDISLVESIVISHDHWDHTGGLWDILKQKQGINVYGCRGFSDDFKSKVKSAGGKLIENDGFKKIEEYIYVTEEIIGRYSNKDISEQAMALDTKDGLIVLTGCAHPGILKIVDIVKKNFPQKHIFSVMGGFHLKNESVEDIEILVDSLKRYSIKKVGPTHCSGEEAERIFKKEYGANFIDMRIGQTIEVPLI